MGTTRFDIVSDFYCILAGMPAATGLFFRFLVIVIVISLAQFAQDRPQNVGIIVSPDPVSGFGLP